MSNVTGAGKRRRLSLFSEVFYPDETSTGHLLTQVAAGLARDFPVSAVVCQPNYVQRGMTAARREVHEGISVTRVRSTRFDKDSMVGRVVNALTSTMGIWLGAVSQLRKGDVAVVVTNPPSLPFAVTIAAKIRRARTVLVIHDLYPDNVVAAGVLPESSFIVRAMHWANRWLYRHTTVIVAIGRDMKGLVEQRLDGRAVQVEFIPNFADLDIVSPSDRDTNRFLVEAGIADRFVVQSVGNIGRLQGYDNMVAAARVLRDNDSIHFLFAGAGGRRSWIEERIAELGLTNITLIEHRPRAESGDLHNACDVAMISLIRGMKGLAVPGRLYNTLAAGKPILAVIEEDSEVATVVEEEQVGWVVSPGNPQGLAEAILAAKAATGERASMGQRARAVAESKYSPEAVIGRFRRLFADLLG